MITQFRCRYCPWLVYSHLGDGKECPICGWEVFFCKSCNCDVYLCEHRPEELPVERMELLDG